MQRTFRSVAQSLGDASHRVSDPPSKTRYGVTQSVRRTAHPLSQSVGGRSQSVTKTTSRGAPDPFRKTVSITNDPWTLTQDFTTHLLIVAARSG